jgi:hypothetical protein
VGDEREVGGPQEFQVVMAVVVLLDDIKLPTRKHKKIFS